MTSPWEVTEASGSLPLLSVRSELSGRRLAGSTDDWGFLLPPILCASNLQSDELGNPSLSRFP